MNVSDWMVNVSRMLSALCIVMGFVGCEVEEQLKPNDMPYTEKHRPQLHFSPSFGWMNDPNGMVYFDGEYHLFYQYYPDSTVWGPMHWGHAVSQDLVHWEHLPIALEPDSLGYIFSGSAVVDKNNTSGFGFPDNPPLVAIFTHHDMQAQKAGALTYETQSIAYSVDRGRTWQKFSGNPVLENPGLKDFRDPKVIWHEESQRWVMVVAAGDRVQFYTSVDLKSWSFASEFGEEDGAHGGVWECPDLFPLKVQDALKWVLLVNMNPGHPAGGSGTQYFVGDFDGQTFNNDNNPARTLWMDAGADNYAGVTWSDAPGGTNHRYLIGWMSNWAYAQVVPTHPWRSAMTLSRKLELEETIEGARLISTPVAALQSLRTQAVAFSRGDHHGEVSLLQNVDDKNGMYEIELEIIKPSEGRVELEFFNSAGDLLKVGYDVDQNEYYIDRLTAGTNEFSDKFSSRHVAPCEYVPDTLDMHLILDVSSIELFADGGKTVMTDLFFPRGIFSDAVLKTDQWPLKVFRGRVYGLKGIWQQERVKN